jgi:integrase
MKELRTQPLSNTSFQLWWTRRFNYAPDIPFFDFHTLRTTSGTMFYQRSGRSAKLTQNWLHHQSARTTLDHYVHEDELAMQAALSEWNAALFDKILSSEQGMSVHQEPHE